MGVIEDLIILIEENLSLLNNAGFNIRKFKVEHHVIYEFEHLCYTLLKIISPAECETITFWPLVDQTYKPRFYRIFCKSMKTLNTIYPQACIPNIPVSILVTAKGEKCLRLLFKLSTLALETHLKAILSPADVLLPRQPDVLPPATKHKIQKIQIDMVKGTVLEEMHTLKELQEEKTNLLLVKETLQSLNEEIETELNIARKRLSTVVEDLEVSNEAKKSLMDVEDSNSNDAYNKEIEEKEKELKVVCRIVEVRDSAAKILNMANREDLSLDGSDLTVMTGGTFDNEVHHGRTVPDIVVNEELAYRAGKIHLKEYIKTCHTEVIQKVACNWDVEESSAEKTLFEEAQEIQSQSSKNNQKLSKVMKVLTGMKNDQEEVLGSLILIQDKLLEGKEINKYIKELKQAEEKTESILRSFKLIHADDSNQPMKSRKNRKSLNTIIKKTETGSVICSYKSKLRINQKPEPTKYNRRRFSQVWLQMPACSNIGSGDSPRAACIARPPRRSMVRQPQANSTPLITMRSKRRSTITCHPEPPLLVAVKPKPTSSNHEVGPQAASSSVVLDGDRKSKSAVRRSIRLQESKATKPVVQQTSRKSASKSSSDSWIEPKAGPSGVRKPRKSLNDVIDRYLKFKERVAEEEANKTLENNN